MFCNWRSIAAMTQCRMKLVIHLGILCIQPRYLWAGNGPSSRPLTAGIHDSDDSVGVRFLTPPPGAAWAPEMRVSLDVALGVGFSADLVREHLAAAELCISGGVEVMCFPLVGADSPGILPPLSVPLSPSSESLAEISAWVQLHSDGNTNIDGCSNNSGNARRHVHNLSSSAYEAHVLGRRGRAIVWVNAVSAVPALESRLEKAAKSLLRDVQGKSVQVERFIGGVRFVGGGVDDPAGLWLLMGLARAQAGLVLDAVAAFGSAIALGMDHPSLEDGGPRAVAATRANAAAELATGGPGAAAASDDVISGLRSSDPALAPPAHVAKQWFALLRYAMNGPQTDKRPAESSNVPGIGEEHGRIRTKEFRSGNSRPSSAGISTALIGAAMRAEWPAVLEALSPITDSSGLQTHLDDLEIEQWRQLVAAARFKPAIESTIHDVGLTALHIFGQRNYRTRMMETEVWETAWSDAWYNAWAMCANKSTNTAHSSTNQFNYTTGRPNSRLSSEYCTSGNCSIPFDMPQLPVHWRMLGSSSNSNDNSRSNQDTDGAAPPHLTLLLPMLPPVRDDAHHISDASNMGSEEDDTASRVADYLCRKFIRPPVPSSHLKKALDESELAADTTAADANCQWLRDTALAPLRRFESQVVANHAKPSNATASTAATTTSPSSSDTTQCAATNSGRFFADLITLTDNSLAPVNQLQRIYVTSLNHPQLPWRNYPFLTGGIEAATARDGEVRSTSDQKLDDNNVPTSSDPEVKKKKMMQKRRPWRVLVVGDSNAIVFDWAHALWGGSNEWVQFDAHWVVGASAYGMNMAATCGGDQPPNSTQQSSNESVTPPSPPPPSRKSSRSGAAEHFTSLNASSYDAILVMLGFVDCNYVAPYRRLRTSDSITSSASPAGADADACARAGAESSANISEASAGAPSCGSSGNSRNTSSGGHDEVSTLATAATRVTAFADAIWAQRQDFPRDKIVFLGPNPPVNTPRYQPPTVAWQDPTSHRLALTAAFGHFLRANAERRGFKFATILDDVLDSTTSQPKAKYLSTVSAFDQHLNEQSTAPLWLRALKEQAGIDLLGTSPSLR